MIKISKKCFKVEVLEVINRVCAVQSIGVNKNNQNFANTQFKKNMHNSKKEKKKSKKRNFFHLTKIRTISRRPATKI